MAIEQLRELLGAQPFGAFSIRLEGERVIEVIEAGGLTLSGSGKTAALFVPGGGFEVIDLRQVVAVEVYRGQDD